MPSVPVNKPIVLKTATVDFKIGAATPVEFSDHISKIILEPSKSSSSPWTSINGKVINAAPVSSWLMTLDLVQDIDTTSFLRFLLNNDGVKALVTATLETGAKALSCNVTLSAAAIGGAADGSNLTSSVSFPVDGKPVFAA